MIVNTTVPSMIENTQVYVQSRIVKYIPHFGFTNWKSENITQTTFFSQDSTSNPWINNPPNFVALVMERTKTYSLSGLSRERVCYPGFRQYRRISSGDFEFFLNQLQSKKGTISYNVTSILILSYNGKHKFLLLHRFWLSTKTHYTMSNKPWWLRFWLSTKTHSTMSNKPWWLLSSCLSRCLSFLWQHLSLPFHPGGGSEPTLDRQLLRPPTLLEESHLRHFPRQLLLNSETKWQDTKWSDLMVRPLGVRIRKTRSI